MFPPPSLCKRGMFYMGLFLKNIRNLQLVQNTVIVLEAPQMAHMTFLLYGLCWLPVCFWTQFKVLVITFKALYSWGPRYLRNYLTSIELTCPTHSSGKDLFQILSAKEFQLAESWRRVFFATAPTLWNY